MADDGLSSSGESGDFREGRIVPQGAAARGGLAARHERVNLEKFHEVNAISPIGRVWDMHGAGVRGLRRKKVKRRLE